MWAKNRCKLFGCIYNRQGKKMNGSFMGEHKCCYYCEKKAECEWPCQNNPNKCKWYEEKEAGYLK